MYCRGGIGRGAIGFVTVLGTRSVAMYSSDPGVSRIKHYGIMQRNLLDGAGNATTDCDALSFIEAIEMK